MDNTVKITINGQEITVPKGTLIVEAAKMAGIDIPVFCYHPKMKPVGACRMCLVEVEKAPKLQTACSSPVADGMIIRTASPRAVAGQNAVIEFLLGNHPLDCPVCDRGGECPLQDNTFGYGKGISRFAETKRHFVKPIPLSDKVLLDRERCIMCYRCVRFTREIAGDETLTVLERGSFSQIGLVEGKTFDSPFSGNTIEICPVGALTSAKYRFRARPWDLDVTTSPSVCSLCSVGCNTTLTIRNKAIARVLSRENAPVDDGWLCDRGRFNYDFVNSPDRLTQPLIREDGQLVPTDWDTALGFIRDRLQEILVKRGGSAIGAVASTRGTNEEAYLLQKLVRTTLASNNVDHTFAAHPRSRPMPFDAASGSIAGLERASTILLVDVNPIVEQPVLDLRLKKAANARTKLYVIGSDKIDLVAYAKDWLKPVDGTLNLLMTGILAAAIQNGLAKAEFVEGRTTGFAALQEACAGVNLDDVAKTTGISRERILAVAKAYAEADNASTIYRREATDEFGAAIVNLALATGQIGRAGAGIYPLVREANEQGALDLGATPDRLPGQRAFDDAAALAELSDLWGSPVPSEAGLGGADMLAAARDGKLAALYLVGQDPVGTNSSATSLAGLDLLVVQDIVMTPTAKFAHVVLPGTTFAEKEGTYTSLERRIQRLRPAVPIKGEARPDWQILRDLGLALGGNFDYETAQDVMAEIGLAAPTYRNITYGRLGTKGLQWPRHPDRGAGTESLYGPDDKRTWEFAPLARSTDDSLVGGGQ